MDMLVQSYCTLPKFPDDTLWGRNILRSRNRNILVGRGTKLVGVRVNVLDVAFFAGEILSGADSVLRMVLVLGVVLSVVLLLEEESLLWVVLVLSVVLLLEAESDLWEVLVFRAVLLLRAVSVLWAVSV